MVSSSVPSHSLPPSLFLSSSSHVTSLARHHRSPAARSCCSVRPSQRTLVISRYVASVTSHSCSRCAREKSAVVLSLGDLLLPPSFTHASASDKDKGKRTATLCCCIATLHTALTSTRALQYPNTHTNTHHTSVGQGFERVQDICLTHITPSHQHPPTPTPTLTQHTWCGTKI
jgi:hypothetical protein